jgi:hypothetical protein
MGMSKLPAWVLGVSWVVLDFGSVAVWVTSGGMKVVAVLVLQSLIDGVSFPSYVWSMVKGF